MKVIWIFLGVVLGIWLVSTHPDIAQYVWDFAMQLWVFIKEGLANLSN